MYLLTPRINRELQDIHELFLIFRAFTIELQEKGMDLLYFRHQLYALLEYPMYYCIEVYPSPDSEIFQSPDF